MAKDNILEVKNLKVSFRTQSGKVQAVRDISFDLERGKTLAIVGESGSGKSVTSKAILGILAGNSIIEGGEILYDGVDILKLTEEEIHPLRGDKISMIFQDPLSSLNPIVKIGKQITEATLLKNKTNRKQAKIQFNATLELLQQAMEGAGIDPAKAKELCATFNAFCIEANHLENSYNNDVASCEGIEARLKDFLFKAEKKQKQNNASIVKEVNTRVKKLKDEFFLHNFRNKLDDAVKKVEDSFGHYHQSKDELGLPQEQMAVLNELLDVLNEMLAQTKPNFFRIGYYALKHPGEDLHATPVEELNEKCLGYLDENFMGEFLSAAEKALQYSNGVYLAKKVEALDALKKSVASFEGTLVKSDAEKCAKELNAIVEASIDPLQVRKDNKAYTFHSSLDDAVHRYFYYMDLNPKEEKRFEKQSAKREALIAKGKNISWKVVPKNVQDLDLLQKRILSVLSSMIAHYENKIANNEAENDFAKLSVELVDFFKDRASRAVYKVTKEMAKEKAIRLMEEVGIAEPRMRYYQYPFEFSGGMRQRIVIAIALTADPEILICDEPTTALDVTIQAQILELINRLKKERNLSIIFITHDLGVVANMADDIAVMYAGKIVEQGSANDIFYDPRHPYTWALLSSMPDLDTKEKLEAIPGTPPNMIYPPVGDAFAERNKYAMAIDFEAQPPMFKISETHAAATWLLHPDAPKVETPKAIVERIARMRAKNNGGEING